MGMQTMGEANLLTSTKQSREKEKEAHARTPKNSRKPTISSKLGETTVQS